MNNKIAVLLPHYNNYNGLELTLESLLQESEDFTLFIFDDGSSNYRKLEQIVDKFTNQLKIKLIANTSNLGITKTLNRGLKHIIGLNKFNLIARLDAGDRCLNNRFKFQKDVFLKDKEVALVGSWVKFVDIHRNKLFDFKPPKNHSKLEKVIHVYNPFVHPSIMCKSDIFENIGYYSEDYPALEDHAFFFKVIKKFKTEIVEKLLLEYEINSQGISTKQRGLQTKSRIKLFLDEYKFNITATYGLLRAFFTYLLPQRFLIFLKKNIFYR